MNITKKKLIPALFFVLAAISLLRLLRITVVSTSSSPAAMPPALLNASSTPKARLKTTQHRQRPSKSQPLSSSNTSALTGKEYRFLSHLISHRAPCNLLVFGIEHQYLTQVSSLNAGGLTIFLEDNPSKLSIISTNSSSTRVYEVQYKTSAKEAYKLLNHARKNLGCSPYSGIHEAPRCKLALTELPKEVYDLKWDVVVVDGPSGEGPETPGRMAAIYTASMLARRGNMTNVVVHDVDQMIEKWFSWEFLCAENLVSSKGRFWNFQIARQTKSTRFCSQ